MTRAATKTLSLVVGAGLAVSACGSFQKIENAMVADTPSLPADTDLTRVGSKPEDARIALLSAGVRPVAPEQVPSYLGDAEAELRERLVGTGVNVKRDGDDLMLEFPSDLSFSTGSSAPLPLMYTALDAVAAVADDFDQGYLVIDGHTDRQGTRRDNFILSRQRASGVASYLLSRGIPPQQMVMRAFGETRPVVKTRDGRRSRANRRIEISFVPLT